MKNHSPRNQSRFRISTGTRFGTMGVLCLVTCWLFFCQSAVIAGTQPEPVMSAAEQNDMGEKHLQAAEFEAAYAAFKAAAESDGGTPEYPWKGLWRKREK